MILRIISVLLTAVCLFAQTGFGGCAADGISAAVFGVPVSEGAVNDSFIDTLGDSDVAVIGNGSGYLKNTVIVFMESGLSPIEKHRIMKNNSLSALGWFCPAGMYAARCGESSLTALEQKCSELMTCPGVLFASPVAAVRNSPDYTPNDPFDGFNYWNEQYPGGSNWWLEAIDARGAWDYADYFSQINIGIVDSGFNKKHEELEGKLTFPDSRSERQNRPASHGDHVAGIIAAKHDNGRGIAGICDNSRLICADWMAESGQLWINELHILFGLLKVVKAGAKVVNFSLGSSGDIKYDGSASSEFVMRLDAAVYSAAISSMLGKGYDFIVVQSAGNGNGYGHPVDSHYNGTFCAVNPSTAVSINSSVSKQDIVDRIIIVSAAENNGDGTYCQASYSNVGKGVSIAAPGSYIFSCDTDSTGYCYKSGTSMAAPMATAAAALVWSIDPSLTGAEVKKLICSPENTKATAQKTESPYFDGLDYMDYPMLNVKLAVEAAISGRYDCGRLTGKFCGEYGEPLFDFVTVNINGIDRYYDLEADGSFSIVAPAGNIVFTAPGAPGEQPVELSFELCGGETVDINSLLPASE